MQQDSDDDDSDDDDSGDDDSGDDDDDGGGDDDVKAAEKNCAKITWFFLITFLATLGVRPVLTFVQIFQH